MNDRTYTESNPTIDAAFPFALADNDRNRMVFSAGWRARDAEVQTLMAVIDSLTRVSEEIENERDEAISRFKESVRPEKAEAWDEGRNVRRDYRGDVMETNPYR